MLSYDAKYIIFADTNDNYVPVIFPNFIKHEVMAKQLQNWVPLSAGFITDENRVHGYSHSLNLKSGEHDQTLIDRMFRIQKN